jgi:hypothetical protein
VHRFGGRLQLAPLKWVLIEDSSNRSDMRVSRFGLDGVLVANGSKFYTLQYMLVVENHI